ncbi:MAG: hypothetical protein KGJ07_00590 [Patescibacteria group bacterium]|nr:hypothetical protein [Patescibacteria group bacterium]
MLNNAIEQFEPMLKAFIENPTDGKIMIYQKWKYITYEIPLDCLALYYDTREPMPAKERKGGLPNWSRKHFKQDSIVKIKQKGILAFIDSHVKSAFIG